MGRRSGETKVEEAVAVAVAIDKDKASQYALKWAVDHLLGRGQSLTLIHVKTKPSSIPTPLGSQVAVSDVKDNVAKAYKLQLDNQAKELFLPFRCFCTRKEIQCHEVVLEEGDIAKAIIDYVSSASIEILVMGAPSKSGLFSFPDRRFKTTDVPSSVCKGAPEFCTMYVISKGKISAAKPASVSPPAKPALQTLFNGHQPSQTPLPNDGHVLQNQIPRGAERASLMPRNTNNDFEIKSPFNRCGPSSSKSYELSNPDSDISFVSSGRPSIDRMFPSLYDNFDPGRLSSGSDWDNRSFGSSVSGSLSFDTSQQLDFSNTSESGRPSFTSSPRSIEDVEAEMRRLKLELKQTIDMYSNACKEALSAKQKASELHHWKLEEEQRYEEARLAEEAALAIAEKEKAKCKAAMEATEAAQRIAEREAQKRINAEKKAIKEAEERKKILSSMGQNDFRYRRYSIEEIEAATLNFSEALKIGEGGYGPVYRCSLNHTPVAVKVLRPDAAQGRTQFQQEVEVLSCIRHPNMVLLLGACPEYGCLVYEHMANGSLDDRLFRRGKTPPISWQLRFRIAAEIGTGLLFLHQSKPEPLVHRDLKPGNILLDRNFVSKIGDVGLARLVPPSVADSVTQYRLTSTAGTFCYIDPEYQQTGMLGIKSDIYSLGIMFLQILTAKPPMGLAHIIERAIEKGNFEEMLDPAVPDWPVEEALVFAKLALKCAELRRKDRPDLGSVILPELNRLRALAEGSMLSIPMCSSTGTSPAHSSTASQDVMSDTQFQQFVSEASSNSSLVPRRISTAE